MASKKIDFSSIQLVKDIEQRYAKRIKAKKKADSLYNLSMEDREKEEKKNFLAVRQFKTGKIRLLDEGSIVDSEGYTYLYLKKGVLKKWYDNLSSDYEGSVNLGHMSYAQFPVILGKWSKDDLSLVSHKDGRYSIDVNLRMNNDSSILQDIKKSGTPLGISAEFTGATDWETTFELGFQVFDSIDIRDIGLVGEAGNAGSGGVKLKLDGGNEMATNWLEKFLGKESKEKKKDEKLKAKTTVDGKDEKCYALSVEEAEELYETLELAIQERDEMSAALVKAAELMDESEEKLSVAEAKVAELEKKQKKSSANDDAVEKLLAKFKKSAQKLGAEFDDEDEKKKPESGSDEFSDDGFGEV